MKDYKIIMNLSSFFSRLLDYLYYRKCYLCSKKCSDFPICPNCYEKVKDSFDIKAFEKNNVKIFMGAVYENELLKIIRAFKYHKKREFDKLLSEILIEIINQKQLNLDDYIVCPVPIHKNRFKSRKYNHMELVANILAKQLGLNVDNNMLSRVKDTKPFYKLSAIERKQNISDAFKVIGDAKNKKILLLDDIITTGATIFELIKILQENNSSEIVVLTITRSNNLNFTNI